MARTIRLSYQTPIVCTILDICKKDCHDCPLGMTIDLALNASLFTPEQSCACGDSA